MNLKEDITEIETTSTRTWVTVGPYSVLLNRTGEGIVIDVYQLGREDEDPVTTTWAHDNDLLADALIRKTEGAAA